MLRSQETMSLILPFLCLASNFLLSMLERFYGVYRLRAWRLREEISSWKSFPSVSILILGKCCASENNGVVRPRVELKYCCDFVKWRACGTRAWEIRSRGTTILKDAASCRPRSLHPRKPTTDGENSHHCKPPTFHPIPLVEASSPMGYHTTYRFKSLLG